MVVIFIILELNNNLINNNIKVEAIYILLGII